MMVDSEEEECDNQYRIIRKLKTELEEEREAAATATSEVLSTISRLQKKLAQEKMESSQYRRMIGVLIVNYDVKLAEKQAQVDSLKFQVQNHIQSLSEIIDRTSSSAGSYDVASNSRTSDAEEDDNGDVVKEKDIDQCWVSDDLNHLPTSTHMNVVDEIKTGHKLSQRNASSSNSIQSSTQDIFEVPPTQQQHTPPAPAPQLQKKLSIIATEKLGKLCQKNEVVPANAEPVWFHREESTQAPSYFMESKRFEQRFRKIEDALFLQRREINRRDEQTELLREMHEKWSITESFIRREEAKKLDSELSSSLYSLLEVAMLSVGI